MAKPPSTALLSILAILATASGSPTPASFLCPSHNKRHFAHSHPTATSSSRIPVKFAQGDDGLWRRVDSYSLYGSTFSVCEGVSYRTPNPHAAPSFSKSCLSSTQVASSSDDRSDDPSLAPVDDIRNSLPLGWSPTPTPSESRPTLILVLALVLAFLICFFIIGCVFWRKNIIKRRKKDLEAEFKKRHWKPSAAEDAKKMIEKESKAKLKILARATARWKANIRHAARQRKGKRVVTARSSQPHQSSHLSNNSLSQLSVSLHSRTSSRRSSVVSLPDELSRPIIDECPSSLSLPLDPISLPTTSLIATSPPAYHHDGQALPVIHSNISHTTSLDRQSSSFILNSPTSNSFHAAHVATDDKTLLARLVDLASRPPEETSTDPLSACDTLVSAPAWHEELEEIPSDLIISNDRPPACLSSSLFPPPPSKEHMATGDLYDYPFSFEGTAALESEPSAPPFHLDPAPPMDGHQIIPSAPPLLDDTEFLVDVHPSAPQLDAGEENPTGQDHDRMASGLPSSDVPPLSSASRRDIGVRDDITLPGYRP